MIGRKLGKPAGRAFVLTRECKNRIRELGWGEVVQWTDLSEEQWARLRAEGFKI
jgi:hypothetical protein